tara:strand:- start:192 stop:314 length:123 start_codon:yes stop_codon:yes gene_type:complete
MSAANKNEPFSTAIKSGFSTPLLFMAVASECTIAKFQFQE